MCCKIYLSWLIGVVVVCDVVTISNLNSTQSVIDTLFELSNAAIQGRQYGLYHQNYYQNPNKYPSYYQVYKPYKEQYGYPQNYFTNGIYNSPYPNRPYENQPLPFFENHRQSVMDALFSIAQNDDLQCVPKLLCEITAGGLIGRQALPVNVNLDSLLLLLSGVNSASMSPVLHFGKAAFLGFASQGNSRKCEHAYPRCPVDPDKLIQYLNNHNGGFFRFFQGLNPPNQKYDQNYAQYFNKYRPDFFKNSNVAEDRIQTKPSDYVNNAIQSGYYYYKTGKGLQFPNYPETFNFQNTNDETNKFVFPNQDNVGASSTRFGKKLKFPEFDNEYPYRTENNVYFHRGGKKLSFNQYPVNNDNYLDIQRPLPNHRPTPNIFPDRTGTGELKLDLEDVEKNYRDSKAFDEEKYRDLLYDSFPKDRYYEKSSYLHFPEK